VGEIVTLTIDETRAISSRTHLTELMGRVQSVAACGSSDCGFQPKAARYSELMAATPPI
jgi:hypothetical protein